MRDAAARLPNGEGTRADICELLKDSQFISPNVTDGQVGHFNHSLMKSYMLKIICTSGVRFVC